MASTTEKNCQLRRLKDNNFCGAYLIDQSTLTENQIQALAKNRYGQSKSVLIDNPLKFSCKYENLLQRQEGYLNVASSPECTGVRFSIFSAETEFGPFYPNQRAVSLGSKVAIDKSNRKVISAISTTNKSAKTEQIILK
jgi:hypothetical protein